MVLFFQAQRLKIKGFMAVTATAATTQFVDMSASDLSMAHRATSPSVVLHQPHNTIFFLVCAITELGVRGFHSLLLPFFGLSE